MIKFIGKSKSKTLVLLIFLILILITLLVIKYYYNYSNTEHIPILCYHEVVSEKEKQEAHKNNRYVISINSLNEQLKYLNENNYYTASISELVNWYYGKIKLPKKTVVLTFDDGYYSFYQYVIPALEKYNMKAINFVIGKYAEINYNYELYGTKHISKKEINEIKEKKHNIEIGAHSYDMHDKYVDSELLNDIKKLHKILNSKYYSYPYGKYNMNYINILKQNGYIAAFRFPSDKQFDKSDNIYYIPRLEVFGNINMTAFKKLLNNKKQVH